MQVQTAVSKGIQSKLATSLLSPNAKGGFKQTELVYTTQPPLKKARARGPLHASILDCARSTATDACTLDMVPASFDQQDEYIVSLDIHVACPLTQSSQQAPVSGAFTPANATLAAVSRAITGMPAEVAEPLLQCLNDCPSLQPFLDYLTGTESYDLFRWDSKTKSWVELKTGTVIVIIESTE